MDFLQFATYNVEPKTIENLDESVLLLVSVILNFSGHKNLADSGTPNS